MPDSKTIKTYVEFARLATSYSILFIQVFDEKPNTAYEKQISTSLLPDEGYVELKLQPFIFYDLGFPSKVPELGAFSGRGFFIGYLTDSGSFEDFLADARRLK